jgi:hypothetical protein
MSSPWLVACAGALLLASPAAAALGEDEVPEVAPRSLAFGGLEGGQANLSLDLGWLRSGPRVDVGVAAGIDFSARLDLFLLHDPARGQAGAHLGLRYTPVADGALRLSLGVEVGGVAVPERLGNAYNFVARGELHAGYSIGSPGLAYLRLAGRGFRGGDLGDVLWRADGESGVGWELQLGRLLLGAEGFLWFRPSSHVLPQWRIRAGWAF